MVLGQLVAVVFGPDCLENLHSAYDFNENYVTYLKWFVGLLPLLGFEATASNWLVELVQLVVEFHLKILHKLPEGS